MLKFPPEPIVHKGNIFCLFYTIGGLVVTLAAGGQCVEAALRTAQDPDNLRRLSKTLVGLLGLRHQTSAAGEVECVVKHKLKRLYFTESFCSLFNMMTLTLQDMSGLHILHVFTEKQANLESKPANWISKQRTRIYYVLLCGGSKQPIMMLRITSRGSELKTYRRLNPRLTEFGGGRRTPGDVVFLFLGRTPKLAGNRSDSNVAADERGPPGLTLGLSALSVVLLWIFLPQLALCFLLCLVWKERQHFC